MWRQLVKLKESIIDYPQEGLSKDVWDFDGENYVLKPNVKKKIKNVLSKFPDFDLWELADEIRIIGSITSNQFEDDADIDVHLVIDDLDLSLEEKMELQKYIMSWFNENREKINGVVKNHPIEVYLQINPVQDYLSTGVYILKGDKEGWTKVPELKSLDYDPYNVYKDVVDKIKDLVKDTDIELGELRRDVIDINYINSQIKKLPKEYKEKLKSSLEQKIEEIKNDIESVLSAKEEWRYIRKLEKEPESLEQILQDINLSKEFEDRNALFKLLDRYKYLEITKELEKMIRDDKISDKELEQLEDLFSVKESYLWMKSKRDIRDKNKHREEVKNALIKRLPVPDFVKKEYPDLVKMYDKRKDEQYEKYWEDVLNNFLYEYMI